MDAVQYSEQVRQIHVRSGGVELAVYCRGPADAPTVVLVHGYPDNAAVWNRVAERLAAEFQVVSYDVRGAGQSDTPVRKAGFRLDCLRRDLLAVVDRVCPGESFHLVGHDWGSIQCWESVSDPVLQQRILSFTSISGPCLDHMGFWWRRRLRHPTPRHLFQLVRQLLHSWYILLFQLPLLPTLPWRMGLARYWHRLLGWLEGGAPSASPSQLQDGIQGIQLYRANFAPRLAKPRRRFTRVPVLLIVPLRDPFVTPAVFDDLEQWAPVLFREDIDGGHWLPVSEPDLLADHIRHFALNPQNRPVSDALSCSEGGRKKGATGD